MVVYNCLRCGYCSNYKNNMKTHVFRKKLCTNNFQNLSSNELKKKFTLEPASFLHKIIPIEKPSKIHIELNPFESNEKIESINDLFHCEFCENSFSTGSNLKKHLRVCKSKPLKTTNDELIEFLKVQSEKYEIQIKMMEMREQEREKKWEQRESILRYEIEKLLEKVGTNITHIENQNNIFINNHGSENLDYINASKLGYLINIPFGALPKLIKIIHFNPNHPENHNIKITNKKLPYASVYKDSKWVLTDKKEVIDNILDKGFNLLDDHYEYNNTVPNSKYETFKEEYEEGNKKLKKQLNKDMELVILNECKDK